MAFTPRFWTLDPNHNPKPNFYSHPGILDSTTSAASPNISHTPAQGRAYALSHVANPHRPRAYPHPYPYPYHIPFRPLATPVPFHFPASIPTPAPVPAATPTRGLTPHPIRPSDLSALLAPMPSPPPPPPYAPSAGIAKLSGAPLDIKPFALSLAPPLELAADGNGSANRNGSVQPDAFFTASTARRWVDEPLGISPTRISPADDPSIGPSPVPVPAPVSASTPAGNKKRTPTKPKTTPTPKPKTSSTTPRKSPAKGKRALTDLDAAAGTEGAMVKVENQNRTESYPDVDVDVSTSPGPSPAKKRRGSGDKASGGGGSKTRWTADEDATLITLLVGLIDGPALWDAIKAEGSLVHRTGYGCRYHAKMLLRAQTHGKK